MGDGSKATGSAAETRASTYYRSVIASMSEGVVVQALDGSIIDSNAAAEAILGLTADQLRGRTSLDPRWRALDERGEPLPGDQHPSMRALRTGASVRGSTMCIATPQGELRWIETNAEPLRSDDGALAGVVSTFTDVTEHRRVLSHLRESEERLQLALDTARMGSWEWDIATGVIAWDSRVAPLVGLEPSQFDGSYASFARCIHDEDRASVEQAIQQALEATTGPGAFQIVHRLALGPDERWVECHGRVVLGADGKPCRMVGTIADVSSRRRRENQLARAQRLEAVGRLAGGVAHDFNNVLTAIVGAAELSLMQATQAERVQEHARLILASADRASRLVKQLLTFARKQPIESRVIRLDALVMDLAGLLRRLVGEQAELSFDIAPGSHHVRGDEGQLEQVVINLVANARDALDEGGHIHLALRTEGMCAQLVVQDDGRGMPSDVVAHAFEPFFTTKPEGTGLGLATCHGIVGQHGGRIRIESALGEGTRVIIELPSCEPAEAAAQPAEERPEPSHGKETVLLVEDQDVVRDTTHRMLREAGYDVLLAGDGLQALKVVGEHPGAIDLVLSDVVMPHMGGLRLTEALAAARPELSVILMSGYGGDELDGQGRDESVSAVLYKPYTRDALLSAVRAALDARVKASA
jgi:PAS domain S-box-containing protein